MLSQRPLPGCGRAACTGTPASGDSRDIHERFGYLSTDAELTEWAPRVRALAEDTALTFVLFNICYRDNAYQLALLQS